MSDARLNAASVTPAGCSLRIVSAKTYESWGYRGLVGLGFWLDDVCPNGQLFGTTSDGRQLYLWPDEVSPIEGDQ